MSIQNESAVLVEIEDAVLGFVAETHRGGVRDGLTGETPLVSSGLIDSVGVIELVEFLERRFELSVPAGDLVLEHFDRACDLARYVAAHRPVEPAPERRAASPDLR
eukprot:jgi/Undpi1/11760/HiC_scaffold_37.g14055.m1